MSTPECPCGRHDCDREAWWNDVCPGSGKYELKLNDGTSRYLPIGATPHFNEAGEYTGCTYYLPEEA